MQKEGNLTIKQKKSRNNKIKGNRH